ncbi:sperm microtubule associated protein 2 [Austrofundulus limnaeus]|uniref:Sperm microtubule associated protein 2 n=1 Tax=Austrofundulus limnaeus TaxID=52670 RepID=A0A2I4CG95_AUSLI|nr:PREDICTED: testicular haploid expressed gene protein [Austrofundulus limnaeus]
MAARMQTLAQPKPNLCRYPDRRSVYWLDKLPRHRTESTTKIELTPRWSDLALSKMFYHQVVISPIWEVSRWALRAVPSERLCVLAQPRAPAAGWQPQRPLPTPLSRGSQTAVASSRLCQLAQAKRRQVQVGPSCGPKPRPKTRLPLKASARVELLAAPKQNHQKWEGERSVCWPVSRAARSCVATQRVVELSCPKTRTALFQGYDPYVVSRAALSASPTPRVQELSLPLPRKCISRE